MLMLRGLLLDTSSKEFGTLPSTIDTWDTGELSEDGLKTLPGDSLADNASYKDKCTREPTRVNKINFFGAMLDVPCTDIRYECDV